MFEKIMKDIISGLSGDKEKDIKYLKEQCDRYKDHGMNREILRACGRLMAEIMPEEAMSHISDELSKNIRKIESVIEEARFNIYKKDYEKALMLYKGAVDGIERDGLYEDDPEIMYMDFNEPFEKILYECRYEPERTVRDTEIGLSGIYLDYGSLLLEMERYDEAAEALRKAMRWNPVDPYIRFEYGEIYKLRGETDKLFDLTRETLKMAFRPESIARCYRNFGYCLVEKEEFHDAAVCFKLSLLFDPGSEKAVSELYYIEKNSDISSGDISAEAGAEIAEKYDFSLGADAEVAGMMLLIAEEALRNDNPDLSYYLYSLFYGVTGDENVEKLLIELKKTVTGDDGEH